MRLSSIMWMVLVAAAAALLYSVKYRVQEMDEEIARLRVEIEEERAAIHVLHAEWAYLTRPDRVERLAGRHLDLKPATGQQLLDVADVPFLESEDGLHLAGGAADAALYRGGVKAPVPRLRPGVIPAGGLGHAR